VAAPIREGSGNSRAPSHDSNDVDRSMDRPTDLADRVTAAAARRDRDAIRGALRIGLVVVALGELTFAVPDLLLGHGLGHPEHAHLVRHAGAFAIAYAIGLLWVAHRPARARAFLPFTIALAGAMAVGALADSVVGDVPAIYETQHLLEVAGMVLVWVLATRPTWSRTDPSIPGPPESASGRVVPLPLRSTPDGPALQRTDPT